MALSENEDPKWSLNWENSAKKTLGFGGTLGYHIYRETHLVDEPRTRSGDLTDLTEPR